MATLSDWQERTERLDQMQQEAELLRTMVRDVLAKDMVRRAALEISMARGWLGIEDVALDSTTLELVDVLLDSARNCFATIRQVETSDDPDELSIE